MKIGLRRVKNAMGDYFTGAGPVLKYAWASRNDKEIQNPLHPRALVVPGSETYNNMSPQHKKIKLDFYNAVAGGKEIYNKD
jgi:hypothetical protein